MEVLPGVGHAVAVTVLGESFGCEEQNRGADQASGKDYCFETFYTLHGLLLGWGQLRQRKERLSDLHKT